MLVECMRSLETLDFAPPDLDITRTDELGYLNRSYLLLLDELNRLFQSLVQEQNAKKNAELEALRAQINPHFLYNTPVSYTHLLLSACLSMALTIKSPVSFKGVL